MSRRTPAIALSLTAILLLGGLTACADRSAQTPSASTAAPSTGSSTPSRAFTQEGRASWYGQTHHGRTTANGEAFDMESLSAAHRTLAFGTMVKVTNKANGRSVTVRINDRGPYVDGRIIDLSARAARDLGIVKNGVATVRIEQVSADHATR